jgi:hypothetical protein
MLIGLPRVHIVENHSRLSQGDNSSDFRSLGCEISGIRVYGGKGVIRIFSLN